MSDNKTLGRIWVFDETSLQRAIDAYQAEALAAYPEQEARIRTAMLAVKDFLHSSHADALMLGGGKETSGRQPVEPATRNDQ